jgi:probable HAF family extracellular repeat protein
VISGSKRTEAVLPVVRRLGLPLAAAVCGVALLVAAASAAVGPAASGQPGWEIRSLGTLGGRQSRAWAINEQGRVIGESSLVPSTSNSASHGFVWDNGPLRDVGGAGRNVGSHVRALNERGDVVGGTGGRRHSCFRWRAGTLRQLVPVAGPECLAAQAINERGQIVGLAEDRSRHGWRAFLWHDGRMRSLGTLGGFQSDALAINENGQIVGSADTAKKNVDGYEIQHAFVWQSGRMRDLGPAASSLSEAVAINDAGQIIGWYQDANREIHAVLWQGRTMTKLPTLGGTESRAIAINQRGQIVGWATTRAGDAHAVQWEHGRIRDLGTVGGAHSSASAINDRGQVVGVSYTSTAPREDCRPGVFGDWSFAPECVYHAFVWQDGTITDLPTLGGAFSEATDINNNGHIVGWSLTRPRTNQSTVRRATLWTP